MRKSFDMVSFCIRQDFDIIKSRIDDDNFFFIRVIDKENNGTVISPSLSSREDIQKILNILHQVKYGAYTIDLKDLDNIILEAKNYYLHMLPPAWLKKYMINYPEDEVYISFESTVIDFDTII